MIFLGGGHRVAAGGRARENKRGLDFVFNIMKEKDIRALLASKEGIEELNPMQERMLQAASCKRDIILLSPTGSGKTVAFGLPLIKMLKPGGGRVQAIVIAPSRELVVQIAGVLCNIGGDYRVLALYGGHKVEDEVNSLKVVPDVIVATPGRLLDHINRRNVDVISTRILVLDEFDKSLELGFEEEMQKIMKHLKNLSRIILTSATAAPALPDFLPIREPEVLDFLSANKSLRKRMSVRSVISDGKDKLEALETLLRSIARDAGKVEKTIIFVNHRESAERVYEYLRKKGASAVLYHGALDQHLRESALAAFNSEARPILVATDLAARGIDIQGVRNVIHYHLPLTEEVYTHRNGRTARVENEGDVYILLGPEETPGSFMRVDSTYSSDKGNPASLASGYETLRISAGKREKLSKGDILGFLTKDLGLNGSDVGKIAVFDHYSLVTLSSDVASTVINEANTRKIKSVKRRWTLIDGRNI